MSLHESAEMYLETIYVLSQQSSTVRSVDVAEHMGYSKPSVSRAVGLLKNGGYITVEELEDLDQMHTVYHDQDKLGGNGFLDSLMKAVHALAIKEGKM